MENNTQSVELDGKIIHLSNELLVAGDLYYSFFHKNVLTVFNDVHAKGLNLINENRFNNLSEIDFNKKVIS